MGVQRNKEGEGVRDAAPKKMGYFLNHQEDSQVLTLARLNSAAQRRKVNLDSMQ